MSDNIKASAPSREEIDAMSTQELMDLIQQDAEQPDNSSSDEELIFYILEVLAKREEMRDVVLHKNSEEAAEKFQQLYVIAHEEHKPIIEKPTSKPRKVTLPRWIRSVAAIAAVFAVVIIAGSITSHAAGFDPWTMFANWTKDVFFFSSPEDTTPPIYVPEVSDLEQVIEKNNVEFPCIPHWLPDGYRLFDVYESVTPKNTTITAEFTNGTEKIYLVFRGFSSVLNPAVSEKSDPDAEPYVQEGCTYYLYLNTDIVSASWYVENWECSLYGPITMDDLKHIISSFYEGK